MSFFGITVHPNLKSDSVIPAHLSITNAALPSHLINASTKGRSTLYIAVNGGQKMPLCSLTPTIVEQFHLDVVIESGAKVSFSVDGVNPISLVGYLHTDEEEPMDTSISQMESVSSEPQSEDDQEEDDDQDMDHHSQEENSGSEEEEEEEEEEEHQGMTKKQPPKSNTTSTKSTKSTTTKSDDTKPSPSKQVVAKANPHHHQDHPIGSDQACKKRKLNEPAIVDSVISQTLKGGLVVTDLTAPNQSLPKVKSGQRVSMRYIGRLVKGKKVFDSNTKGQPFTFQIGRGEVIKGWDMGILGMHVGQKRKLMIPAKLAYGKQGALPDIPPNADLEFEVKVVGMK